MQFPYIPISSVIADVRAEMKTLNQRGDILDEDCKAWAIECIREIGGANYVTKPAVVKICNNIGKLPDDFYKVDEVYICSTSLSSVQMFHTIWFVEEGLTYYPNGILYPGDAMTGTHYCTHRCAVPKDEPTYIIRFPNQIRCGIRDAVLGLNYLALPVDDGGEYLMQDEIYTFKAVKGFIMIKLLMDGYINERVSRSIFLDIKKECDDNIDMAQAIFKFPDPADNAARGSIQDHRYDSFNLR